MCRLKSERRSHKTLAPDANQDEGIVHARGNTWNNMNKARLAEAGRGIIQKDRSPSGETDRRFEYLDRVLNEKWHSSQNDAWHFGKTKGMDGTKECITKAPPQGALLCVDGLRI